MGAAAAENGFHGLPPPRNIDNTTLCIQFCIQFGVILANKMANVKTGRPFDYIRMPPQQNTNTRELMVLNNINSHYIILFRGGRKLIYWIELTPRCARAEFALSIDFMLSWIGRSLCHHWRNELFAHSTIYIYIYTNKHLRMAAGLCVRVYLYAIKSIKSQSKMCFGKRRASIIYGIALCSLTWRYELNAICALFSTIFDSETV